MRRLPSRRAWLALLASVGLHGLLVVVLLRSPLASIRPHPGDVSAVDVELIEIAPHVEGLGPSLEKTSSQPPPRPVSESHPARRQRTAPRSFVPESNAAQPPSPDPGTSASEEAPRAEEPPTQEAGIPVRAPDLTASALGVTRRYEAPRESAEPRSTQELVEGFVADAVGRNRVDTGMADHYFADLGRALIKVWDADRSVSEHGLRGFFDQAGENTQLATRIWMTRAAAYGKTGSPVPAGSQTAPVSDRVLAANEMNNPLGVPGPANPLASREAIRRVSAEQWKTERRTLIRVTQKPSGEVLAVDLVHPSSDPLMDREAVEDVRTAADRLPPPPSSAASGKDRIVSLWQFELVISISPPIPTFTFEFDEALKFVDARLPLDRRIYKHVRLIAVE